MEDKHMPPTSTPSSPRQGFAIAAGVTGLVVAAGITIATLLGWVRPAQTPTASAETSQAAIPVAMPESPMGTPQVVWVPVTPIGAPADVAASAPANTLPVNSDVRRGQTPPAEKSGVRENAREHGSRVASGANSDRSSSAAAPNGRGHTDDD
jgi:hypothetical protein